MKVLLVSLASVLVGVKIKYILYERTRLSGKNSFPQVIKNRLKLILPEIISLNMIGCVAFAFLHGYKTSRTN